MATKKRITSKKNQPATAKSTVTDNELICGRTIDQLKKMPAATLATIAKLHGKKLGTKIHFSWFHFLKKDEAIKLLVIGDNSDAEAKVIVDAKTAQMETNRQFDGSAIREWHAGQKELRNELEAELVEMTVNELLESDDPDFSKVDRKIRSKVVLAYNEALK